MGQEYLPIKQAYDKLPMNYSCAVIYVVNSVPHICNFYGNPIFKNGMKALVAIREKREKGEIDVGGKVEKGEKVQIAEKVEKGEKGEKVDLGRQNTSHK